MNNMMNYLVGGRRGLRKEAAAPRALLPPPGGIAATSKSSPLALLAALTALGAGAVDYARRSGRKNLESAAGQIKAMYGKTQSGQPQNAYRRPSSRKTEMPGRGVADHLMDYAGTIGGGLGAATLGAVGAGALSSENKIRNAIIGGLVAGTLGAGAGYAYDSGMFDGLFGKKK